MNLSLSEMPGCTLRELGAAYVPHVIVTEGVITAVLCIWVASWPLTWLLS